MTPPELARIKARVTPTICKTFSQNEHDGAMESRIEGRISADDFMAMCAAIESAARDMEAAIEKERYDSFKRYEF